MAFFNVRSFHMPRNIYTSQVLSNSNIAQYNKVSVTLTRKYKYIMFVTNDDRGLNIEDESISICAGLGGSIFQNRPSCNNIVLPKKQIVLADSGNNLFNVAVKSDDMGIACVVFEGNFNAGDIITVSPEGGSNTQILIAGIYAE